MKYIISLVVILLTAAPSAISTTAGLNLDACSLNGARISIEAARKALHNGNESLTKVGQPSGCLSLRQIHEMQTRGYFEITLANYIEAMDFVGLSISPAMGDDAENIGGMSPEALLTKADGLLDKGERAIDMALSVKDNSAKIDALKPLSSNLSEIKAIIAAFEGLIAEAIQSPIGTPKYPSERSRLSEAPLVTQCMISSAEEALRMIKKSFSSAKTRIVTGACGSCPCRGCSLQRLAHVKAAQKGLWQSIKIFEAVPDMFTPIGKLNSKAGRDPDQGELVRAELKISALFDAAGRSVNAADKVIASLKMAKDMRKAEESIATLSIHVNSYREAMKDVAGVFTQTVRCYQS